MFKKRKRILSFLMATIMLIVVVVPAMAATPAEHRNLFVTEEATFTARLSSLPFHPIQSKNLTGGIEPQPRPANLVTVQAWEVRPGVIRCTILNSGIDMLDDVTVYIAYSNPKGTYLSTTRYYGVVGFIAVSEDIYIGTDWTSATAHWAITDGGNIYYMSDVAGE